MSGSKIDPEIIASLVRTGRTYKRALWEAERDGRFKPEERQGVVVSSLMRAIDRIAALPHERDLTDEEVRIFGASLIQVATAAVVLLDILPLPSMTIMLVGFDTGQPN